MRQRITKAAYAVLTELKRGDAQWHVQRHENGDVTLDIDHDNVAALKRVQARENLATISDVIVFMYKQLTAENHT